MLTGGGDTEKSLDLLLVGINQQEVAREEKDAGLAVKGDNGSITCTAQKPQCVFTAQPTAQLKTGF